MRRIPQPDEIKLLDIKESCRVATTANINLSGEQTVDDVSIISGDRVLVKDQTNAVDNGIYICSSGNWLRAVDFDNGTLSSGAFTFIEEGTTYDNNGFILSNSEPVTVGTTELSFVQFTGTGEITAGTGLTKTGNELDVIGGDGIIANADEIEVAVDNSTLELSDSDGSGQVRIKDGGVSLSKLSTIEDMRVIGNTSGSPATPAAISILDEDTMSSNSNTALATQQSIKAYVDANLVIPAGSNHEIQYNNSGAFGTSSQFVWDDSNNRLGIGTNTPSHSLHIRKAASDVSGGLFSTSVGEQTISNNNAGWWLSSKGHNPLNKYTPAIKFGSTDTAFTTDNPKYLAGIVGRATEYYQADTDGGMSLDFLTFPDNGGVNGGPTARMTISQDGRVGIGTTTPETILDIEGEGPQESQIRMQRYNNDADGPDIRLFKARGTIASPSDVSTDDTLGAFNVQSRSSGSFSQIGGFTFLAGTSDASKSRFSITTKPTGQSVPQTIVSVEESGNVSFGIGTSNRYQFPTADGNANQVLKTDGSGTLSFSDDTDTTYSAGSGLSLGGTEFSSKTDNVTITNRGGGSSDSLAVLRSPGNLYISGSLSLSASSYNGSQDVTITCNVEGTELASTGESGGNRFLREDGDGTCSWQLLDIPNGQAKYDTATSFTVSQGNPSTSNPNQYGGALDEYLKPSIVVQESGQKVLIQASITGEWSGGSRYNAGVIICREDPDESIHLIRPDSSGASDARLRVLAQFLTSHPTDSSGSSTTMEAAHVLCVDDEITETGTYSYYPILVSSNSTTNTFLLNRVQNTSNLVICERARSTISLQLLSS